MLIRFELSDAEQQAARALAGVGDETAMRTELADAVDALLDYTPSVLPPLTVTDQATVATLAALTVRCRSIVERYGYTRDIVNVPLSEQPARIAKQLGKLLAAFRAIGASEDQTQAAIRRCALDSIPATRRLVLERLIACDGNESTTEVGEAIGLPSTTARSVLEDLAAHGVIERTV